MGARGEVDRSKTRGRGVPLSGFRGGVLAGLVAVAVACLVVIGASAASKPHQLKSKFTKQDHVLLAKKRAQGVHTVSLLIATPRGKTAPVAKKLRKLGAKVVYRHNRLGYLRVIMPSARRSPPPSSPVFRRSTSMRFYRCPIHVRTGPSSRRLSRSRAQARPAATPTCLRGTPARRSSSSGIQAGTAAALPSASSTRASTSTIRA